MSAWENKILDAFISHYFASDSAQQISEEENRHLRLRTSILFPNFDNVHHDEKKSYLEAAEALERKGIIKLRWKTK